MISHENIIVTSTAFKHNEYMPIKYTGYGVDQSPPFTLSGLVPDAKSLAIIMVDLDIPFIREYPHWVIWNLPVNSELPANIPMGETLPTFGDASQGIAYGKHKYRGPKPPKFIRKKHRYVFTLYALDARLNININSNKRDLLKAMNGHILKQGSITGLYKNIN